MMGGVFLSEKKATEENKKNIYIVENKFVGEKKLIDLLKEYIFQKIKTN